MCHDRAVTWVQIIGEPGMGKSRLLSDARDALDLRPERFHWLRARAFQGDEKHAFMLVRRMWFDRFQIAEDAPLAEAEARWLDQFAALRGPDQDEAAQALGLLLGLPFHDSPHIGALRHDPAQVKGRAYVVSRELLSAMRAELPIVILLEDAQWADPSSWDYLVRLLLEEAPANQHGVLVVATARSEWNPPTALLKHAGYQPINLRPLSEVCVPQSGAGPTAARRERAGLRRAAHRATIGRRALLRRRDHQLVPRSWHHRYRQRAVAVRRDTLPRRAAAHYACSICYSRA